MVNRTPVPMVPFGVKCFALGHIDGVELDGSGLKTISRVKGQCLQTSCYQSQFKLIY